MNSFRNFKSSWSALAVCALASLAYGSTPLVTVLHGASLTGGAVVVAEVKNANGQLEKVALMATGSDTVPVLDGGETKLWWVCKAKYDSLTLAAFNPGSNGSTPSISLDRYPEALPVIAGKINADTTFAAPVQPTRGLRHYKIAWSQALTVMSTTWYLADGSILPAPTATVFDRGMSNHSSVNTPSIEQKLGHVITTYGSFGHSWSILGKPNF